MYWYSVCGGPNPTEDNSIEGGEPEAAAFCSIAARVFTSLEQRIVICM